jgi:hypothetical protein
VSDLSEPTLDGVVEAVTDTAHETVSEGHALALLAGWGIRPTAQDWHEACNLVREADDLEDGTIDASTLADGHVYDLDGFRIHLVNDRRNDVRSFAKDWLLDAQSKVSSVVEFGVEYPSGQIVHTFRNRSHAEQKQRHDSVDGAQVVEQTVTTIRTPWSPARDKAEVRPALAVVR